MATRTSIAAAIGRAVVMTASLSATSCGSGGGGGGSGGSGNTGGGNSPLVATFDSIQQNVFSGTCETCHVGASAPLGLRLDPANSFALLVGVASGQEPSLQRVDPGNPDDSYLIRKLEGTAATGERMPLGLPALPQADINVIRQWISDGALRTPSPPPSDPIRVSSLSPLPNSQETMLPTTIMAMFDRELNATSVDATTFRIERSGGDGTFTDGNEVAITADSVTVPSANPQSAVANLSSTASVEDTYRITLSGTGNAAILDLDGNALDGEFTGTFPSGNEVAGGDFVAEFEVLGVQPTLASIQEHVFTPTCSGCHTGGGNMLPASLDLTSADNSFSGLVNVTSEQDAAFDRVEPGSAANSYLIQKLEGTASMGSRMPLNGTPLDQSTIDAIGEWIDTGAAM